MPDDLARLAISEDIRNRFGTDPPSDGLQDLARGLPPPQPTPYQIARAQAQQQRWGMPPISTQLQDIASKTAQMPGLMLESTGRRIADIATNPDPREQARAATDVMLGYIGDPMLGAERGAFGALGGRGFIIDPATQQYLNSGIGKIIPENELLQRYWAGMDNPRRPNVKLSYFPDQNGLGHRLSLSGTLVRNGETVGTMQRLIKPEEGYSYHAGLHIDPDFRGQGIAKEIYRNQRDVYRQIGVHRLGIMADEDGAATWGHFGFKPLTSEWIRNRPMMMQRLDSLNWLVNTGVVSRSDMDGIRKLINSPDPRAMWRINDFRVPLTVKRVGDDGLARMEESNLGREVLRDIPWNGEMNYRDPEQARRQDDFLR